MIILYILFGAIIFCSGVVVGATIAQSRLDEFEDTDERLDMLSDCLTNHKEAIEALAHNQDDIVAVVNEHRGTTYLQD